ncbi:NAD-dependent epimerase/dehydratase family protein [Lutibacter sp.]
MILFTGASGFLGHNILPFLKRKYKVETIGLSIDDTYKINLAKEIPVFHNSYDIVLHAAGKAHSIPKSLKEEKVFFQVNLQGTINLCKALEKKDLPKSLIFISTVAVYGVESGTDITEEHKLQGNTPYALSKIQAEEYLQEWCYKNGVTLGILRPSLIAGKNPPGNLGAMIKGIKTGKYFRIGNGSARKSVLMAEDIARIIPKLSEVGGTYNVCDNYHPSFAELENLIAKQLNKNTPASIPYWTAKSIAKIGDVVGNKFPINSSKLDKITNSLTFSNEKAKRDLNWKPLYILENFKIS